jgi:hypothetical protein
MKLTKRFLMAIIIVGMLVSPISAKAATTTNISVKIPGCNATFDLRNVSTRYREHISEYGIHDYEFFFPAGQADFSCDSPAFVFFQRPDNGDTPGDYYYCTINQKWDSSVINKEANKMCAVYVKTDGSLATTSKTADSATTHIIFHYNASEDDMRILLGTAPNYTFGTIPADQLKPIASLSAAAVDAQTILNTLATYKGNTAEFNAYYYFANYPDLQAAFGANGDALLKHWNEFGKSEGRIANMIK